MPKTRTPIIKPRTQGGTFYTFASALEDVGLNINELKNKVSLSHYVLLNIPAFDVSTFADDSLNQGDYTFAEHFQNYALNMETVLRNQENYNFACSLTVSERVFWKWMQKEGFISFVQDSSSDYYIDASTWEDSTVKGFGLITSGAQRTDAYGIYNETFVQIPSSYGQSKVLFKPVADKNYYVGSEEQTFKSQETKGYIENIDASTEVDSDNRLHTGLSAKAIYDDNTTFSYTVEDETQELCVEFALSELRRYYDDDTLNYDDIGMGNSEAIRPDDASGNFEFNAVLVYYSVYDSTGMNILATNAYGLLLLDSAELYDGSKYKYPSLVKKQSDMFDAGNSYAFRLNIKTSSVYNGDVKVADNSTPAYQMSTDFNETIRNLATAVEVLRSNANLISVLCDQNTGIKELVIKSLDKIDDIENDIVTLKSGKLRELKVATLVADAIAGNTLDSSLKIGDSGSFDGDKFTYNTIEAKNLDVTDASIETISVKTILGENDEISFGEAGRMTSAGLYSDNVFFNAANSAAKEDEMSVADASAILSSMTVLKDGNFKIKSDLAAQNIAASEIGAPAETDAEISDTVEGVNSKLLIAALVKKIEGLNIFQLENGEDSSAFIDRMVTAIEKGEEFEETIGDHDDRIDTLETKADELTDDVSTNKHKISLLDSSVATLINDVSTNTHHLSTIDSSITALFADVSTNASNIQTLMNDVSTNTTRISELDTSLGDTILHVTNVDSSLTYLYENISGILADLISDPQNVLRRKLAELFIEE